MRKFIASCDIIFGEANGMREQFGLMGVIRTGSSVRSLLMHLDFLTVGCCLGSVGVIGGTMPGVFALVIL